MNRQWMFVLGFMMLSFCALYFDRNIWPDIMKGRIDLSKIERNKFDTMVALSLIMGSLILARWL